MTLSFTAFFLGALGGLGFPELLILLALIMAVVVFSRSIGGRNRPTRYCKSCGRGLTQPLDAPFCCYCGQRIG
jgi:hypothetical protein